MDDGVKVCLIIGAVILGVAWIASDYKKSNPTVIEGCEEGVHQFQERYDTVPLSDEDKRAVALMNYTWTETDVRQFKDLVQTRIYVGDICVKCGKTVSKEEFQCKNELDTSDPISHFIKTAEDKKFKQSPQEVSE